MQTLDANKMDGSGAVSILIYRGGAEGLCYIKKKNYCPENLFEKLHNKFFTFEFTK